MTATGEQGTDARLTVTDESNGRLLPQHLAQLTGAWWAAS
jgi:hypothetical protein